jgi:1,5-anhydro-D-fructose reductase (1,5-anhydro-D-mannitol-forming)
MKWAFVGASNIASEWMVHAVRAAGDEVVAVVSGSAERAESFARQHGIPHGLTHESALGGLGVEAIYISSTNEKHEASTLRAAAMGCHVLCEKPLATSLDAALRMVDACRQAGVVMGTNHHLRHNSAHRQIRDILRENGIGKVTAARVNHSIYLRPVLQGWRIDNPEAGGGVVLDIAVHNADSLAFLLNEYPVEVLAMTSNTGMAVGLEDNAMSIWRFASGVTAFTHQGFNTPHATTRLEILGSEGSLEGRAILSQAPGGELVWRTRQGEKDLELSEESLYTRCVREMHKAIAGEPNDLADGIAGAKSLAVALAIRESAASGKAVTVRYE